MTIRQNEDFIHEDAVPPNVELQKPEGSASELELITTGKEEHDVEEQAAAAVVEDPPPRRRSSQFSSVSVHEGDSDSVRQWKSSPFAVGLVPRTWQEEMDPGREDKSSIPLRISGLVCGTFLKRERLGHNTILWKTNDGDKPRIRLMTGPFWFVTAFVTIPIISAISFVLFFQYIAGCFPVWVSIIWGVCLATCLFSLVRAATMDPGIQYRYLESPQDGWIWNDQAKTYRSPTAKYVSTCAVVVEGYDHVCPWVGTAIGANNMRWFRRFVWMVGICFVLDAILIMMYAHGGISTVTVGCSGL
ncbi:expressed unknown protein [Seminavis robusta]|uniref:Palmitoyltransferase n=1 Tax=Seminavis robusta TaxID=568900 RepID=A0A9N8E304_9STRA|nr:expressed unknown protein [Seminavis robusta]|eukprot:Sro604_g174130.1 n/a (302) ;mRNA; r:32416-33321